MHSNPHTLSTTSKLKNLRTGWSGRYFPRHKLLESHKFWFLHEGKLADYDTIEELETAFDEAYDG